MRGASGHAVVPMRSSLLPWSRGAPFLYGSPGRHPHTDSSSIPHDAIQAEVARHLDGLKQQKRAEQEREPVVLRPCFEDSVSARW